MDLLVVVFQDDFVLQRLLVKQLSWQRLQMFSCDHALTLVKFHPTGMFLITGHESGEILSWNVENGKLLSRNIIAHDSSILSLDWSSEDDTNLDKYTYNMIANSNISSYSRNDSQSTVPAMHILASCDTNSNLIISVGAQFKIGELYIKSYLDEQYAHENLTMVKTCLSDKFDNMWVLVTANVTSLLSFNLGYCCSSKNEIRKLSFLTSNVLSTMDNMYEIYRKAFSYWKEASENFFNRLSILQKLVRDENENGCTVEMELLNLLTCGFPSNPIQNFLVHTLKVAGLQKLKIDTISACNNLCDSLVRDVLPFSDHLSNLISQLSGLTIWGNKYKNLGVDKQVVDNLTIILRNFNVKLLQLVKEIVDRRTIYENFFNWLRFIQIQLFEDDMENIQLQDYKEDIVSKFIENGILAFDTISPYFDAESKFKSKNHGMSYISPTSENSLERSLLDFKELFGILENNICHSISQSFTIQSIIQIDSPDTLGSNFELYYSKFYNTMTAIWSYMRNEEQIYCTLMKKKEEVEVALVNFDEQIIGTKWYNEEKTIILSHSDDYTIRQIDSKNLIFSNILLDTNNIISQVNQKFEDYKSDVNQNIIETDERIVIETPVKFLSCSMKKGIVSVISETDKRIIAYDLEVFEEDSEESEDEFSETEDSL
eukprot:TRINITY_DN9666_c0_g1_i1.p1 TRINITY_DN9666_c0_g1~~TRINITY_DN9666_c0_g1_i1.p1  ORF type:complete len:689 (-),score=112.92 TRINITY_DN9666_c0_g1_i1:13-1983(-)